MKIIAHRGASALAPENTLAAFRMAWEHNADGIELDVHLSADDILTVIHDPTTTRTCRKALRVNHTPFEQLKQLCPAYKYHKVYSSERLVRLEQVFEIAPPNTSIAIELKPNSPERLLHALRSALSSETCPPHPQLLLMSFHQSVMRHIATSFPECTRLWLFKGSTRSLLKHLKKPDASGWDGLGLSAKHPPSPFYAKQLLNEGLTLSVWVENDPKRYEFWHSLGFNYLTTDDPASFSKIKNGTCQDL